MITKLKKATYTATKAVWEKKPYCEHIKAKHKWDEPFKGNTPVEIDLREFSQKELQALMKALSAHEKAIGVVTILRDIKVWLEASLTGADKTRARTTKQAEALLIEYLVANSPNKVIFSRAGTEDDYPLGYYVEEIEYQAPDKEGWGEGLNLQLYYIEFGKIHRHGMKISAWHCVGETPAGMLDSEDMIVETSAMVEECNANRDRYKELKDQIGKQFLAKGLGSDGSLDGNDDGSRWYGGRLRLDKDGEPTKVVIDVFSESERESRSSRHERDEPRPFFWAKHGGNKTAKRNYRSKEAELDADSDDFETEEEAFEDAKKRLYVPTHPYLAVFDLKRHLRMKIHVANLTEYVYNTALRKQLILPEAHLTLLDTLLASTDPFVDIIKGKTGNTIILCQGPPGTGKTLTAEIYAEYQKRPLYSVQCAQLGIDPESLEKNLKKVLVRGRRWNAVILLDEGDVYLHERGSDLVQNAVVGVFLRILEYNENTLFITTNRGDHVDDAILSRCTAQIRYTIPTKEHQEQIWRTLVVANNIVLPLDIVKKIAAEYPTLSGRDVKNLLKLANLMAKQRKCKITPELIREAKQFKPAIGAYTWEADSTSPSKPDRATK